MTQTRGMGSWFTSKHFKLTKNVMKAFFIVPTDTHNYKIIGMLKTMPP
jgi:hypothetical protein